MVIHNQQDWRTPEQALEWDTALVRGVFWHICKRYDEEASAKLKRQTRSRSSLNSNQDDDKQDRQEEKTGAAEPTVKAFNEHRLVTKADVLIGIKTTENFLEKRPFLRSLTTMLACCSNEKEMESVGSYVKYRLRERTISFAMVRDKLHEIYKKHVDLLAFEARIEQFKATARAKSTWCVRDPKSICKSPSQFYGVHNIPPKPKTQKQIDMELQLIKHHAVAVANNAISLVLSQMVDAARPKSRQKSAKLGRRDSLSREGHAAAKLGAAAKAKQKRDQHQAEARLNDLRVQVLIPGIVRTRHSTDFGSPPVPSQDIDKLEQRRLQQAKQLELLALVEANGDHLVAERLLHQLIPRSGFVRVVEHLANLGGKEGEAPDEWAIFKLWKSVYRSRTLQSIQRLEQ